MLHDLFDEIKSFMKGATMDALIPGLVFVLLNKRMPILSAVIYAIGSGALLFVVRLVLRQKFFYALFGLLGVMFAGGLALIGQSGRNYFLPDIISSFLLMGLAFLSLVFRYPLAAWISHLTRGWDRTWFWRKDIKPAYMEVTGVWFLFLLVRCLVLIDLFRQGEASKIFFYNMIMGMPATLLVLSLSYLYGIWRLRKLGGPGIDEFRKGVDKPWRGQTKGF